MSLDVETTSAEINSVDDLVAYLRTGEKSVENCAVGIEYEKFLYDRSTNKSLTYEDGVQWVMHRLVEKGWRPEPDVVAPVALRKNGQTITIEPGGQFEFASHAANRLIDVYAVIDTYLDELSACLRERNFIASALGFRPFETVSQMTWMPRERYRVMREYMANRGRLAQVMMLMSSSVQINLDYISESDMLEKVRCATWITPIVSALSANSPFTQNTWSGFRSRRTAMWLEVDPKRCGLSPWVFNDDFGYRWYVEWLLDLPLLFVFRQGVYHPAADISFRDFMNRGFADKRATLGDFDVHMSTVFPDVRIKRHLEVRAMDSGPKHHVFALAALWKGLLYDEQARRLICERFQTINYPQLVHMQRAVAQDGLRAHGTTWTVRELAEFLVQTAAAGLQRQGEVGAELFEMWHEAIKKEKTLADVLVENFGAGPFSAMEQNKILDATACSAMISKPPKQS